MKVNIKTESFVKFSGSLDNEALVNEYLTESIGSDIWKNFAVDIIKELQDKTFFRILKENTLIGFGAFKKEIINEKQSFVLYEFFIRSIHRSISQLFDIKRQLIAAMKRSGISMWYACVDNESEKKIRAYQGLGFKPMIIDEDYIYMGQQI